MNKGGLDKCPEIVLTLSEKEAKLILELRKVPFGEVVVKMENFQPTRIIVARENILLS